MKISRVNHTRAAVIKRAGEKSAASGILYDNPAKSGEELTLDNRIKEGLNANAKRLYSILREDETFRFIEKAGKKERNYCREASNNFKKLVCVLVKYDTETEQIKFLRNLRDERFADNKRGSELGVDSDQISQNRRRELIEDMVKMNTRKSLCKEVNGMDLLDVINRLLWAMCCVSKPDLFEKSMKNISDTELCVFLEQLNWDYGKEKQLDRVVRSIRNQNVKIQPKPVRVKDVDGDREMVALALSNAEHKKKKYLFQFLIDFADGDEEKKQELFCYIKRLIVLFYLGSERYENLKCEEISGWAFKLENLREDVCYSRDIEKKIEEKGNCTGKPERRRISMQIRQMLRVCLNESYKSGSKYLEEKLKDRGKDPDGYEKDSYWLRYIKDKAGQLLERKKSKEAFFVKRLCERTWEEWVSFICIKYIDMGKGVYHFAMPDLSRIDIAQDTIIGEVPEPYCRGLTSFDYEKIKAYENFDREVSTYITFAVNNFARAVQDKTSYCEDILYPDNRLILHDSAVKRILCFFGGCSTWGEKYDRKDKALRCDERNYGKQEFFKAFQQELTVIRNASFHYTAVQDETNLDLDILIQYMFKQEYGRTGEVIRNIFLITCQCFILSRISIN